MGDEDKNTPALPSLPSSAPSTRLLIPLNEASTLRDIEVLQEATHYSKLPVILNKFSFPIRSNKE
jgi:hypothetical protein